MIKLLVASIGSGRLDAQPTVQSCRKRFSANYGVFVRDLSRMMSAMRVPRATARDLPSVDQAKLLISPEGKCVSCFGGPPWRDWRQMSETPPFVTQ